MKTRTVFACFTFLALALLAGWCGDDSPTTPGTSAVVPDVSSILPSGASSSIQLTINGSKFGDDQESGGVQVAGIDAAVGSWSATRSFARCRRDFPKAWEQPSR